MGRARYDVGGKVIFITGAARGIGLEAARRLHARGASIALVGLEPEELEARAAELGAGRAAAFHADVTDAGELRAAVDGAVARFGGIDVVIANAGIAAVGTVATIDPEAFDRIIEVNLLGVWRTIRATLPHVVERKGYLLTVSSLSAVLHAPLMGPYTAAKAGVEALTDATRAELAHTGARVGCAYFGFIDTDMVRKTFDHPAAAETRRSSPGFLTNPIPLAAAGEAIERGVLGRRRITYAPRWVGSAIALRGILQPLSELAIRLDKNTTGAIRRADAEAARDAEAASRLTTPQG